MNPITEFKQHKANITNTSQEAKPAGNKATLSAKVQATATANTEIQPCLTTQKPVAKAQQGKRLSLYGNYSQVSYLFQQAKWGSANCKKNHPDSFHLKKDQQKQLTDLCEILSSSDRLFESLLFPTKSGESREYRENIPENVGSLPLLSKEQRQALKKHRWAVGYLVKQMQSVADYIEQVEQAEGEALNALCYCKD